MEGLHYWMPALIPLTSLIASVVSFFMHGTDNSSRTFVNQSSALVNIGLVIWLMIGVHEGLFYEFRFPLFLGYDIVLHADAMSLLFVFLSSVLWLLTTIYAVGYFKGTLNQNRFFGFFNLCVFATSSIAMSGNLFTFLVFYELLTVATYPLVVHRGTREAIDAGRIYLVYTLIGGSVLLLAMVWMSSLAGPVDFIERGIVAGLPPSTHPQLVVIFFMLILGFGVKAALVPFHGWLPVAMIAPAPVSALLHAVAVVKAGAFGIVRVVFDIYGVAFCQQNGLLEVLVILASFTIIYGSVRALFQDDLKKRLAFSTVSQVSYIMLGVATLSVTATIGGIVHLVHQGLMKITLFMCAGNLQHEMKIRNVSEMDGIGKKMPLTMAAFTVAAFGMIGVPPLAGFISKWYLGLGALEAKQSWIVGVLVLSTLLNAGYFLPPIYRAWFKEPSEEVVSSTPFKYKSVKRFLLFPPLVTAVLTILVGLLASLPFSPLKWASLIAFREY
ncbi:MAG: monovalent cation/H+ antiporter subunit D family protein [Chlamydiales bacterium]